MQNLGINPAMSGPALHPPLSKRRRRVRHKVHIPAYAQLVANPSIIGLDLNEILNISEEGMAVKAASKLAPMSAQDVCLDLSETNTKIRTRAEVVWSDDSGRAGMHFQGLDEASVQRLKQWLFINSITAYLNHGAAAPEGYQRQDSEGLPQQNSQPEAQRHLPDHSTMLAALAAVQREVQAQASDLDAALQLIARRSLALTRGSGAAVALTEGGEMICRATAGPDAPSLGARLKVGSGFSGECVRRGRPLRCDDAETDEIVDRQSCRALGIRSILAVPIRWNEAVIGLIEVFSPHPFRFDHSGEQVLLRLAEISCDAIHQAGTLEAESLPEADGDVTERDEFAGDGETESPAPLPHSRRMLFIAVIITLIVAGFWIITPRGSKPDKNRPSTVSRPAVPAVSAASTSYQNLRQLAMQGDPAAEFALGARYATGEDVSQDYGVAVQWFAKAAEQGHVGAEAILGAYYWAGRGVPQDLVKAYFWSVLAQTGGDEASKYRVEVLASRMTRGQIVAAQQQANEWIKEHQSTAKATQ